VTKDKQLVVDAVVLNGREGKCLYLASGNLDQPVYITQAYSDTDKKKRTPRFIHATTT